MASKADKRRRWAGAVFLFTAVFLLIAGQTFLARRLSPVGQLVLWFLCFVLTCLAIGVAFLDAAITRKRLHDEQRSLLEGTLTEIARRKNAHEATQSENGNDRIPKS